MKKITIELNKKTTSEELQTEIVKSLNINFEVIEDTNERFEHLRFITIDGKNVHVDLNGIGIELRNMIKPHICYSIYVKYIYAVNVEF